MFESEWWRAHLSTTHAHRVDAKGGLKAVSRGVGMVVVLEILDFAFVCVECVGCQRRQWRQRRNTRSAGDGSLGTTLVEELDGSLDTNAIFDHGNAHFPQCSLIHIENDGSANVVLCKRCGVLSQPRLVEPSSHICILPFRNFIVCGSWRDEAC